MPISWPGRAWIVPPHWSVAWPCIFSSLHRAVISIYTRNSDTSAYGVRVRLETLDDGDRRREPSSCSRQKTLSRSSPGGEAAMVAAPTKKMVRSSAAERQGLPSLRASCLSPRMNLGLGTAGLVLIGCHTNLIDRWWFGPVGHPVQSNPIQTKRRYFLLVNLSFFPAIYASASSR